MAVVDERRLADLAINRRGGKLVAVIDFSSLKREGIIMGVEEPTTEPTTGAAAAAKLAELGLTLDPDILYDVDSMFPKLTGWGAKGQIKTKHKLLRMIEPFLSEILLKDEHVMYVSKGVQYSFIEQYFLGLWAALINQTVFVQTNTRLLLIHSDTYGRPKHTNWMIYYSQIEKFKPGWTGTVSLQLKDGKRFTFTGFQGTDKKQMPAIFEKAMETYREFGFDPQVTQSRENLCSKCNQVVPKGQYKCEQCGQQYWKPSQIALRSLVFPS
ncbi:MAG: hypothetical protein ACI9HK_003306 [Pirellulaceae bacterium]|jgi:hypothetical protein